MKGLKYGNNTSNTAGESFYGPVDVDVDSGAVTCVL